MAINNSSAIVNFEIAGDAIGVAENFTAQNALADGSLIQILPDWKIGESYTSSINFVYTPRRHIALKIRAFIDYFISITHQLKCKKNQPWTAGF